MQSIKDNKKTSILTQKELDNISIFKDQEFTYLYKKTERIVSVLYMLSNFFGPEEPIKWEIRHLSCKIMRQILSLSTASLAEKENRIRHFSSTLFNIVSVLDVAYSAGFISHMNFGILKSELERLIKYMSESESFGYSIGSLSFTSKSFETNTKQTANHKGQNKRHYSANKGQNNTTKDKSDTDDKSYLSDTFQKDNLPVNRGKDQRREAILKIIGEKGQTSIKDISDNIKDCSEKTIQRILISLIAEGMIQRQGERRWSTYSLI